MHTFFKFREGVSARMRFSLAHPVTKLFAHELGRDEMASTMACWGLQVSDYLAGLVWWQAIIAGAAVGMSSAGFYDLVKSIYQLFVKKDGATE